MIDYQTLISAIQVFQSWASALQAFFAVIMAFLTATLVYITHKYATATDKYVAITKKMLEASVIDREISYIEKKLEKYYLPLQNALRSVYQDEANAGEQYKILKAGALNEKLKEIGNYKYLASPELRELIPSFSYAVYCFDNGSELYSNGDVYYKMDDSLSKIEMVINEDIKNYLIRIQELTH